MNLPAQPQDKQDKMAADAPAIGERILLSLTLRVSPAAVGIWQTQRVEVLAMGKAAARAKPSTAGEVLAEGNGIRVIGWEALPLTFWREWAESMWANITSPKPQLFIVYRGEGADGADGTGDDGESESGLLPLLTAAGDEAAGYSEVDAKVLNVPLPDWLGQKIAAFVAAHYKPEEKKVRRRQ